MESNNLVLEGVELMFLGMGAVFSFLILLVICTSIMSVILSRYFPEALPAAKPVRKKASAAPASVDPDVVAAIGAAIKQHRARQRS
ncbi:MAG: OadG family protein [Pseudomonadaceae bacterium]